MMNDDEIMIKESGLPGLVVSHCTRHSLDLNQSILGIEACLKVIIGC